MITWVLASSNKGKLTEIQAQVDRLGVAITLRPQGEFGVTDVEETGLSFVENALIKARHASQTTGLPALADDSGLCVSALNDAPGIYSARYAGPKATDADRIAKLLKAMQPYTSPETRQARFVCAMVWLRHAMDPTPVICVGQWHGILLNAPRGQGGFGYDPIFWVDSHQCSAAELSSVDKNKISHRGLAMQQLANALAGQTAVFEA